MERAMKITTPIFLVTFAFLASSCTLFGPYSKDQMYLDGAKPSIGIEQLTTGNNGDCTAEGGGVDKGCVRFGKVTLTPPGANLSFLIYKYNQQGTLSDIYTCASPAEVATTLSSSGAGNIQVPVSAAGASAAVALGGSETSTQTATLTLSTDVATHYIAAASFYTCLGVASNYIQPNDAAALEKEIIEKAADIAIAGTKSPPSTNGDASPDKVASFSISGSIKGLTGSGLVLADNVSDTIPIAATATTFLFPGKISSGKAYAVTVKTQPSSPKQNCAVTANQSGAVSADVKTVAVTCISKS